MWQNPICPTARKERGELQEQECSSVVWSGSLKNSSVKGMKFIESMEPHSDIPKITISVFPSSERFLYRKRKCLKGEKSVTAVSIDRHYVCPIVRGKETKSIKFDTKVNNIQIDGISFIEHLSFKTFNEGIRLKNCIRMQQKLMNVRVRCVAADSIYANNANRKFCTKYGISTSFVRKGRVIKDEPLRKALRSELSKKESPSLKEASVLKSNITRSQG